MPRTPCHKSGCPNLVRGARYCPDHRPKRRGSTTRWRRLRERVLRRDEYRCQESGCGVNYPLTVHHVNGDPDDNRMANLLTLCWPCHRARHVSAQGPARPPAARRTVPDQNSNAGK